MSPDLAAAYCDTGGSALRAIRSAFLVAGLLLVSSAPAPAGNNAGASAYLSWDPMDLVTNLPAVPSGPFPLYLRLSGATDISKLAVTLRWTQYDSTGAYYVVMPESTSTDSCGWNTALPPGEAFAGDSTYTWTIGFPVGSARTCVAYRIASTGCLACPADFYLPAVLTMDSGGRVDTLTVTGDVVILGGICPSAAATLQSVVPTGVVPGEEVTLKLRGSHFREGMRVYMRDAARSFNASAVAVSSASEATAVVAIPTDSINSLRISPSRSS